MESSPSKLPNSLKSEHLKEGISPIIVSIGPYARHRKGEFSAKAFTGDNVQDVNFFADADTLEAKKLLNGGEYTYVMSPVDNLNKFSANFLDCTGLVVVGVDKKTGENVSFLTHQDPSRFLKGKVKFASNLQKRLFEIYDRCVPQTVDAVIVGGKSVTSGDTPADVMKKIYSDSIQLISSEVKQTLSFEPVVFNGPKTDEVHNRDDIYFDNKNRRLYFVRQRVNPDIGSFTYSNIEEEKGKWEK